MSSTGPVIHRHVVQSPELHDYLRTGCSPPHPAIAGLVARTAEHPDFAEMQVPLEQAGLLTVLAGLVRAELVVDIGTFTGLSALSFALGMPAGGTVITCDITRRWLATARASWDEAGVADRIEFRLGAAESTLAELPEDSVDIVFVDADKLSYPRYVELAVPRLRRGGLLLLDNVLLHGNVLAPEEPPEELQRMAARSMCELNGQVAADPRLEVVMLPISDGLTIARKRP
ncbi:class I SAM-dependent methyltransferase [Saccharopolyspora indica]|uniref:O-methyltransferase n=1 Tax=Saccharopolyspora indica TaxID=1229659 RepID=UPI0022EB4AD1|nr:class I SAM-dependent methyltransferase [Saccharopolyspora indica]MDA3647018.1 class I SAM-dependent methyltransferase [Saccharopolyspora indica]